MPDEQNTEKEFINRQNRIIAIVIDQILILKAENHLLKKRLGVKTAADAYGKIANTIQSLIESSLQNGDTIKSVSEQASEKEDIIKSLADDLLQNEETIQSVPKDIAKIEEGELLTTYSPSPPR